MKIVAIALALMLLGCATQQPAYVEGTITQLGAYVPCNGSIYGLEIVQYLNGCKVNCSTGIPFRVHRTFDATNSYLFGMVTTTEHCETEVENKGNGH